MLKLECHFSSLFSKIFFCFLASSIFSAISLANSNCQSLYRSEVSETIKSNLLAEWKSSAKILGVNESLIVDSLTSDTLSPHDRISLVQFVIGRDLSTPQVSEFFNAHEIGGNEGFGLYSLATLREKLTILKEGARLSETEARQILRLGLAGRPVNKRGQEEPFPNELKPGRGVYKDPVTGQLKRSSVGVDADSATNQKVNRPVNKRGQEEPHPNELKPGRGVYKDPVTGQLKRSPVGR